jgi:topoisomerase-4 subunit A
MSQIGLEQQSVAQFSENAYLDYSMYVILDRAYKTLKLIFSW